MLKSFRYLAALAVVFFGLGGIAAQATGIGGGIVIGGAAGGYAGQVAGTASSISQGSAVAVSQINGNGTSFQHTDGISAGTAGIGGAVTPNGAQVITVTTQLAQVNSYGTMTGNNPVEIGGLLYNGTGGVAKTDTAAVGTASFQTAELGGFIGIGGIGGLIGF